MGCKLTIGIKGDHNLPSKTNKVTPLVLKEMSTSPIKNNKEMSPIKKETSTSPILHFCKEMYNNSINKIQIKIENDINTEEDNNNGTESVNKYRKNRIKSKTKVWR